MIGDEKIIDGVRWVRRSDCQQKVDRARRDERRKHRVSSGDFPRDVMQAASLVAGVHQTTIKSRYRGDRINNVRTAIAIVMADIGNMSQKAIGKYLGGRDSSTVCNLLSRRRDLPEVQSLAFEISQEVT